MGEIIIEKHESPCYYCIHRKRNPMKIKPEAETEHKEINERTVSYKPAEGNYRVVFSYFKNIKGTKTKKPKIRVFWDILFPDDQEFRYRVWKDYLTLDGASKSLKNDLKKIFGEDLSMFNDASGDLDTDNLLGKEAEAKIGKKFTNEYNEPLTVVEKLHPVGTFNFEESPDSQIP